MKVVFAELAAVVAGRDSTNVSTGRGSHCDGHRAADRGRVDAIDNDLVGVVRIRMQAAGHTTAKRRAKGVSRRGLESFVARAHFAAAAGHAAGERSDRAGDL